MNEIAPGTSYAPGVPAADNEWESIADDEPVERLLMDDFQLIDEITNPIRSRLMGRLRKPASAAELADQMGVPVTRLYHHINRLESTGLIRVVATRKSGAVTERRYQVTAKNFGLAEHLFDPQHSESLASAMGALFDVAKAELQSEIEQGALEGVGMEDERWMLGLSELHSVSPDRARALVARLKEVVEEFSSDGGPADEDAHRLTFFIAAFPRSD